MIDEQRGMANTQEGAIQDYRPLGPLGGAEDRI